MPFCVTVMRGREGVSMMRLWGRLLVALGLLLAGAGNAQAA